MTKEITLSGEIGKGKTALVDDCDYDKVFACPCYLDIRGYVYIVVENKKHLLHRYIMGISGK